MHAMQCRAPSPPISPAVAPCAKGEARCSCDAVATTPSVINVGLFFGPWTTCRELQQLGWFCLGSTHTGVCLVHVCGKGTCLRHFLAGACLLVSSVFKWQLLSKRQRCAVRCSWMLQLAQGWGLIASGLVVVLALGKRCAYCCGVAGTADTAAAPSHRAVLWCGRQSPQSPW